MGAHKGNKTAEKYSRNDVLRDVNAMLKEAKADERIIEIRQLFNDRPYTSEYLSRWAERFKDDDDVSQSIKKLKEFFLQRLYTKSMKGDLNPAMTIFNLKNNYGQKDKTEQDVNVTTPNIIITPFERK